MKSLLPLPENTNFGSRTSRRKVRLASDGGRVIAQFSDIYHEMSCEVFHDGETIQSISGAMSRVPTSLCQGATQVLEMLTGAPLDADLSEFYGGSRAKQQCTHLYDLAVMAIRHCRREGERIYEAEVPDMVGVVDVSIRCNGKPVHQWRIKDERIVVPVELSGKPVIKGFMSWAHKIYSDPDKLEAALILSRTIFIARGRRFSIASGRGHTLDTHKTLEGSCYAYQPARASSGHYLGTNERDFSKAIELKIIK